MKGVKNMIPLKLFEMYDFEDGYYEMIEYCYNHGADNVLDENKKIREIDAVIHIRESCIEQILKRKIPAYAPCQKYLVNDYVEQFLRTKDELKVDEHVYTYPGIARCCELNGKEIDQMHEVTQAIIKEQQSDTLSSNRHCVMINMPIYVNEPERPCLQSFYLKRLSGNEYEARIVFRSNDLCTAFTSNAIGILTFINEYIMKPSGCRLTSVVWHSFSMHIYHTDFTTAEQIVNREQPNLAEHKNLREAIVRGLRRVCKP